MQELNDTELLRQYAGQNSEAAFAELVQRHVPLVYSAALRKTGNPSAAEEVTQAVFIILARKAHALGRQAVLSGWLYQTTRLTAANFLRTEIRRAHREQEAYMESLSNETTPEAWPQIMPLLEDAMGRLGEKERNAIVLRFFEGKSFQEIGLAVGASENASKKRVTHALEKLRKNFLRQGVNSTAEIIAGAISANSVQTVPAALLKSVTAVALAKSAAASTSTLTLIKGALKLMAWTKAKTIIVAGAVILLTAGTTTFFVREASSASIRDDDPVWEMNSDGLAKAPHVVIVRPTHFHDAGGRATGDTNGFLGGRSMSLQPMIAYAYGWPFTRMAFSSNLPFGPFDYLITVREHPQERFQAEIKKRFGVVGRKEIRETDMFLLKVKTPGATGIMVSDGKPLWMTDHPPTSRFDIHNAPISALAGNLEGFLAKPVLDETGLTNRYDTKTKWTQTGNHQTDEKDLQRALLSQLGLELIPTNMPIEMLVVDKAN